MIQKEAKSVGNGSAWLGCVALTILLGSAASAQETNDNEAGKETEKTAKTAKTEKIKEVGEIEEVTVTGSQIAGAKINEALAVSVLSIEKIESMGVSSMDELLDMIPEMGNNFFNEASAPGITSVRGDTGAFNMRNLGTGNTLALINGRRMVQEAGFQTERVGGSFVPTSSANSASIPVFGIKSVEILRDGASAIYGADAVAGVVNTVMKNDFEGLTTRVRFDTYDHLSREDWTLNLEWGKGFNDGATNIGVFVDYYNRDRVNAGEQAKWGQPDWALTQLVGTPWEGNSRFVNDSDAGLFGQFDFRDSAAGLGVRSLTDSAGEFETFPIDSAQCSAPDAWVINSVMCARPDQGTRQSDRFNLNDTVDILSALERVNVFLYLNHEFDNGVESFTELHWYQADTNALRNADTASLGQSDLQLGPQNYFNPFGPCGSPNRLPDSIIGTGVPCAGVRLEIDSFRFAEVPEVVDNDSQTFRVLQGFRGAVGEWNWETAAVWSEAERDDINQNRISNTLIQAALDDPTPNAFNPFSGGITESNDEQARITVLRRNKTDLKMIDFKLSTATLFDLPAGPVGFLAGAEYREESKLEDQDPRLDGTIQFTAFEGATFPIVSDVAASSTTDNLFGERDTTSLFVELAVPLHETLNVQLAARYEDFSDVEGETVGRIAFGWRPFDPVLFRGSVSQAYRVPSLEIVNQQLVLRSNTRTDFACQFVEDTTGVNLPCRVSMQRRARGSADLVPEKSDNLSFGFVVDATDSLTFTLDYWEIEKKDTIGLFGEENHTVLDLLLRLQAGTADCANAVFNPLVLREDPDNQNAQSFLDAGICPAGPVFAVNDTFDNLDTRTVSGYDVGVYWEEDTRIGDFQFSYNGTFFDEFEQSPGAGTAAETLFAAIDDGTLPSNIPVLGFGDLKGVDGNPDERHLATLRWSQGDWGAGASMNSVGSFYQTSLTLPDGTKFKVDSMTTYNVNFDYNFDAFNADTRVRLGINNVTDERAPLADDTFNFFADVHRDMGIFYYLDVLMRF